MWRREEWLDRTSSFMSMAPLWPSMATLIVSAEWRDGEHFPKNDVFAAQNVGQANHLKIIWFAVFDWTRHFSCGDTWSQRSIRNLRRPLKTSRPTLAKKSVESKLKVIICKICYSIHNSNTRCATLKRPLSNRRQYTRMMRHPNLHTIFSHCFDIWHK